MSFYRLVLFNPLYFSVEINKLGLLQCVWNMDRHKHFTVSVFNTFNSQEHICFILELLYSINIH